METVKYTKQQCVCVPLNVTVPGDVLYIVAMPTLCINSVIMRLADCKYSKKKKTGGGYTGFIGRMHIQPHYACVCV